VETYLDVGQAQVEERMKEDRQRIEGYFAKIGNREYL